MQSLCSSPFIIIIAVCLTFDEHQAEATLLTKEEVRQIPGSSLQPLQEADHIVQEDSLTQYHHGLEMTLILPPPSVIFAVLTQGMIWAFCTNMLL